jgi:hypothetical protein
MVAEFPRKGRAQRKVRQSCGEQERQLNSPEAAKGMDPELRRQKLKTLAKQKRALRRRVPSSAWETAAWDHLEPFPPPWDHPRTSPLIEPPATAMKTCVRCGRETPPNCVGSAGVCLDCAYAGMSDFELSQLPASAGVIDMGRLKKNAKMGRQYGGG